VQRWLGHPRISTTAIYIAACGPGEIAFAARFWHSQESLVRRGDNEQQAFGHDGKTA
jgi:hypothetical protein